jgi:hypothetical protein
MNRYVIGIATGLLILIGSNSAVAYAMDGPSGPRRHMAPSPEAVEACEGKSEGAEVEFTNPRGEKVKAVCKQFNCQLVAVPEGGFRVPKGAPLGGMYDEE